MKLKNINITTQLLDHQIEDANANRLGKVDDLEISPGGRGQFYITALLTGPGVYQKRLPGFLEKTFAAVRGHQTTKILIKEINEIDTAIKLKEVKNAIK